MTNNIVNVKLLLNFEIANINTINLHVGIHIGHSRPLYSTNSEFRRETFQWENLSL